MVTVSDIVSFDLVEKIQSNHYMKFNIVGVICTQKFYDDLCKIIDKEKVFIIH